MYVRMYIYFMDIELEYIYIFSFVNSFSGSLHSTDFKIAICFCCSGWLESCSTHRKGEQQQQFSQVHPPCPDEAMLHGPNKRPILESTAAARQSSKTGFSTSM